MITHNFTPGYWLEIQCMVKRKFCPVLKQCFSSKIEVTWAEKTRRDGNKWLYHFWIQREKLVQKHLHFQKKHKGPKNL